MLQSLTLGSTPPMFSFIRALEVPEDGDHVVSVLFGLNIHSLIFLTRIPCIEISWSLSPWSCFLLSWTVQTNWSQQSFPLQAFEAVMEFVSGNDMNAEISVQLIRGIWTTFYVSKLAIKGTVCGRTYIQSDHAPHLESEKISVHLAFFINVEWIYSWLLA